MKLESLKLLCFSISRFRSEIFVAFSRLASKSNIQPPLIRLGRERELSAAIFPSQIKMPSFDLSRCCYSRHSSVFGKGYVLRK